MESIDVAIIGAGPAGLATAIEAKKHGVNAVVFERQAGVIDKACGEGLMPRGQRALAELGVLPLLRETECAPFDAIVYRQEDGTTVRGALPAPGGLGIRRLELSRAFRERAAQVNVDLRERCGVRAHARVANGVRLETDDGPVLARVLIAADGLHSPARRRENLDGLPAQTTRYGLRRHFLVAPWSRAVEVHFAEGLEAYVTPAGAKRVGVAFLFDPKALGEKASFEVLLRRFPALEAQVAGAPFDSESRGAGVLEQHVTCHVAPRFALVGDAAGYVDAITGEGLTLAFEGALTLGSSLPSVLAQDGSIDSLWPYERAMQRAFASYARLASLLVWTAQHPPLRRAVIATLAKFPRAFEWALAAATK